MTLVLIVIGAGGCGKNLRHLLSAPSSNPATLATRLGGSFLRIDNGSEDLAEESARPQILIFAQETCGVCAKEVDGLRAALKRPDLSPTRVRVYSVLVGAEMEDAREWAADHRVPWIVGVDPDAVLFKQYCEQPTVPCVVVQLPGAGIVFRHNGLVSMPELVRWTGPWEEAK